MHDNNTRTANAVRSQEFDQLRASITLLIPTVLLLIPTVLVCYRLSSRGSSRCCSVNVVEYRIESLDVSYIEIPIYRISKYRTLEDVPALDARYKRCLADSIDNGGECCFVSGLALYRIS